MEKAAFPSPALEEYFANAKVLIVDQAAPARQGLKTAMGMLGLKSSRIFMAESLPEAADLIRSEKPEIVLCDFTVQGKSSLALLQRQREEFPGDQKNNLFFLVTANTSQSAVAQAAEEDIDGFILKPYTLAGLTGSLIRAANLKLNPNKYLLAIDKGKSHLGKEEFPQASAAFQEAMTIEPRPSLACFYEGLTLWRQSMMDRCQFSYQRGLTYNRIHYKCLVGLFDVLMSLNRYSAAYEVVRQTIKFFPSNPNRIASVMRLAIQTGNFADIETFYEEFLKLEEREDYLVKCVCAGLIVCAKHYFSVGETSLAQDLVNKAVVAAAARPFLLRKSVELLVQQGHPAEARKILKRFPDMSDTSADYLLSVFYCSLDQASPEKLIHEGQRLVQRGLRDIYLYEVLAAKFSQLGLKDREEEIRLQLAKIREGAEHDL